MRFNVLAAKADFDTQTRRIELLRQLIRGTDQVRKDYFDQWREVGRRTLLDVLTAENEHLNTRLSLVASEVDQSLAVLRMWHEASGLRAQLLDDNGQSARGTKP
jgi:adhesin transport system outer membrane protein